MHLSYVTATEVVSVCRSCSGGSSVCSSRWKQRKEGKQKTEKSEDVCISKFKFFGMAYAKDSYSQTYHHNLHTLINSMGHTAVASTPPAMHPAVIAVNGFFDFAILNF